MSQREISRSIKIERTCDGCGSKHEWEMVEPSPAQIEEMTGWYTVIREVYLPGEGFTKLLVQACGIPCIELAALKLALPPQPQDEPADDIDLGSLRAKNQVN